MNKLLLLKNKIKELANAGSRCRTKINESYGDERSMYWDTKREIGLDARYHLIAYALLRGVPYSKLESNCVRFTYGDPDPMVLDGYRMNYKTISKICIEHCLDDEKSKWTPEYISSLVNEGYVKQLKVA